MRSDDLLVRCTLLMQISLLTDTEPSCVVLARVQIREFSNKIEYSKLVKIMKIPRSIIRQGMEHITVRK